MSENVIFISLLIGCVAFCYASVGHGGASGYLGVLSFFALSPQELSSTALILNILVSATSAYSYIKGGHFRGSLLKPFLMTSIPLAFLGGWIHISLKFYAFLLALALIGAAVRMAWNVPESSKEHPKKSPPQAGALLIGSVIGILSGILGIGGGIFLSPILILAQWATTKEAATTSAIFILINSVAGLMGRALSGSLIIGNMLPYLVCAFVGGYFGSHLGANRWTPKVLRRILGFVLLLASFKLMRVALLS